MRRRHGLTSGRACSVELEEDRADLEIAQEGLRRLRDLDARRARAELTYANEPQRALLPEPSLTSVAKRSMSLATRLSRWSCGSVC